MLSSILQPPPRQPQHQQTRQIPLPPAHGPEIASALALNSHIRGRVREPRHRVQGHQAVHAAVVDARVRAQQHRGHEEREVLHRVGARCVPPLDRVERGARELAGCYECFSCIITPDTGWLGT